MSSEQGVLVIAADTGLTGQVLNCRRFEVRGAFEGQAVVGHLVVHPGGRFHGSLKAEQADVHGNLEGDVRVKNLIRIANNGSVVGSVRYGSLALEPGGELAADVRNVPPTMAGDFEIQVPRGQSVAITEHDITAYDPDDRPENLTFTVTRLAGGSIVVNAEPPRAASTFTQAELASGKVLFVHDGSDARFGGFDVVVTDAAGASSGAPRTVAVVVV